MGYDTSTLVAALLFCGAAGLVLLGLVGLAARFGQFRIVRRRLACPVRGREAIVDFLVSESGPEVYQDVVACSLLGADETPCCGTVCRSTGVAPFARPAEEPPGPAPA